MNKKSQFRSKWLSKSRVALFVFAFLLSATETALLVAAEDTWVNPHQSNVATTSQTLGESPAGSIESQREVVAGFSNPLTSEKAEELKRFFSTSFANMEWKKMVASLSLVLGGYLAFLWIMRLLSPQRRGVLPKQVVEIVGTTRFNSKHNLQLVRLGNKLLLLLVGSEGTQSIGEVTDPDEVEMLVAMCNPTSSRKSLASNRARPVAARATPPANSNAMMDQFVATLQRAFQSSGGKTEYEA